MDPLLDLVLDEKPVMDPKERFKVSEAHKSKNGRKGKATTDATRESVVME